MSDHVARRLERFASVKFDLTLVVNHAPSHGYFVKKLNGFDRYLFIGDSEIRARILIGTLVLLEAVQQAQRNVSKNGDIRKASIAASLKPLPKGVAE